MNFDTFSQLNWLAILVAGLAYFMLGAIWYSFLFQKPWIRLAGVNPNAPDAKKGVAAIMFTSFLLMLVAAIGIALFLSKVVPSAGIMSGIKTGLVAGICFSATGMSISYVYEKRPLGLHLINAGYNICGCVLAGTILSMWK
jgi:hypothetical protein